MLQKYREKLKLKEGPRMRSMDYTDEKYTKILYCGIISGYKIFIVSRGTHPCAYICLGNEDKEEYKSVINSIKCHGGVTYFGYDVPNIYEATKEYSVDFDRHGTYIGWDYAHGGDKYSIISESSDDKEWTTEEIFDEVLDVISQFKN